MKMDDLNEANICRLCLRIVEFSQILGEPEKAMLEDILPDIDVNSQTDFFICTTCIDSLRRAFEFRHCCLEVNWNPEGPAKPKTDSRQCLDEILGEEMGSESPKQDPSQWCCLCNKLIENESDLLRVNHVLLEMLESCLPELEEMYLAEPVICETCSSSLESTFTFMNTCTETEKKIKKYTLANGVDIDGYVDLYGVIEESETNREVCKMEITFDDETSSSHASVKPKEGDFSDDNCDMAVEEGAVDVDDSLSVEFYEQALLLALLIKRRKNRKRQRRFWVDPHGAERYKKGMFYNGYRDLRRNNTKFKEYFRMSVGCFDELYSILRDEIAGKDTVMRRCVPAEEKLLLTLRYFSRGTSMASLKPEFLLGVSTISIIIHQVCKSIINTLAKRCIVTPTDQEDWLKIAEAYAEKCNFPNCLGAIGGKNVKISKGKKARRTGPTVVLLATCDTDYRFTYVELDGSDSDYFKDLELHNKVTKNMLHIPPACRLGSSSISAPFVFVGNESFSNTPYLMRPYGGRNLCPKRVNFNARLEEARVMIDRAFAILTSRWWIFQRPLDVSQDFTRDIVQSCCILHNFVLDRDGYKSEDITTIRGLTEMYKYSKQGGKIANSIREDFATYFLTEEGGSTGETGGA